MFAVVALNAKLITMKHIRVDGGQRASSTHSTETCAPTGKKIKVKVVEVPNVPTDGCIYAGVEIKTHRDQRRTGYRFCSKTYLGTKFESNSNVVPVIVYEHEDLGKNAEQSDDYSYTDEGDTSDEDSEEEIEGEEVGDGDIEEEDASEHEESLTTGTKLLYRYV
ncbi:hypothetical protein TELCIR_15307 [Teladorsagia circumcincta]|uniref:Uncharacterized protein n=1 Tax=Teladorsagia circumcincta TaxID=45464 RepID=A0A2G9TYI2_TELCI|nr:hypothetical protein TELCIR_15307 [Teladorsagia circumcincta]